MGSTEDRARSPPARSRGRRRNQPRAHPSLSRLPASDWWEILEAWSFAAQPADSVLTKQPCPGPFSSPVVTAVSPPPGMVSTRRAVVTTDGHLHMCQCPFPQGTREDLRAPGSLGLGTGWWRPWSAGKLPDHRPPSSHLPHPAFGLLS